MSFLHIHGFLRDHFGSRCSLLELGFSVMSPYSWSGMAQLAATDARIDDSGRLGMKNLDRWLLTMRAPVREPFGLVLLEAGIRSDDT